MEKLADVYSVVVDEDGYTTHYKNGLVHREERDESGALLPAVYNDTRGHMEWKQNGVYCRENDLPTYVDSGNQYWYVGKSDTLHRETLDANGELRPAVIEACGTMKYYVNGRIRCAPDGPAIIWECVLVH